MNWLEYIRTFWPIAVILCPLVLGAGIIWLKSQFATRPDMVAMEARIVARIDAHDGRLADGSEKLADLDKRVALVEDDCESTPSKSDLNQSQSILAGRVTGVESALRGVEKQVATGNDLLQILIEQGLRK